MWERSGNGCGGRAFLELDRPPFIRTMPEVTKCRATLALSPRTSSPHRAGISFVRTETTDPKMYGTRLAAGVIDVPVGQPPKREVVSTYNLSIATGKLVDARNTGKFDPQTQYSGYVGPQCLSLNENDIILGPLKTPSGALVDANYDTEPFGVLNGMDKMTDNPLFHFAFCGIALTAFDYCGLGARQGQVAVGSAGTYPFVNRNRRAILPGTLLTISANVEEACTTSSTPFAVSYISKPSAFKPFFAPLAIDSVMFGSFSFDDIRGILLNGVGRASGETGGQPYAAQDVETFYRVATEALARDRPLVVGTAQCDKPIMPNHWGTILLKN